MRLVRRVRMPLPLLGVTTLGCGSSAPGGWEAGATVAGNGRVAGRSATAPAARFPWLAWKYESIAYALTLKHVGMDFQTMYLAATAMGLAPCAVGRGDADLFVRAAGTDYRAETSVGEFLLGSQRPGSV